MIEMQTMLLIIIVLLVAIGHCQWRIERNQYTIMANLTALQATVAAEDTVIDSAVALIAGLAQQIKDLPADQAAIDALAADVQARSDALAAAVAQNTPAAP